MFFLSREGVHLLIHSHACAHMGHGESAQPEAASRDHDRAGQGRDRDPRGKELFWQDLTPQLFFTRHGVIISRFIIVFSSWLTKSEPSDSP